MSWRRAAPRSAGALLFLAWGGCSGEGEGPAYEARPALAAEELIRIGSLDDPETSLTSFHVLHLDSDGRIYTLHSQEAVIRIHSPTGVPLASVGGEGEGPGELMSPTDLGIVGDEMWALNGSGGRVSYFTLDGEFLRDETFRPETAEQEEGRFISPPFPIGRLEDGSILTMMPVFDPDRPDEAPDIPLVRMSMDGSTIDTVGIQPGDPDRIVIETERGLRGRVPQPFSQQPLVLFSHEREASLRVERPARPGLHTFRVVKSRFAGDTVFDRSYPFDPIAVTPAIVDSVIDQIARRMERPGLIKAGTVRSRLHDEAIIPPHLPPILQVRAGHDGTTWLALNDTDPTTRRWIVLLPNGDVYGEVVLPGRFNPLRVTRSEAWGSELDEFDVPYIVSYAIHPERSAN